RKRSKQPVGQVWGDVLLVHKQRRSSHARCDTSRDRDVAATGECHIRLELTHDTQRLPHADGDAPEIGDGPRREITAQLASGDAAKGYALPRHQLRFQAVYVT